MINKNYNRFLETCSTFLFRTNLDVTYASKFLYCMLLVGVTPAVYGCGKTTVLTRLGSNGPLRDHVEVMRNEAATHNGAWESELQLLRAPSGGKPTDSLDNCCKVASSQWRLWPSTSVLYVLMSNLDGHGIIQLKWGMMWFLEAGYSGQPVTCV